MTTLGECITIKEGEIEDGRKEGGKDLMRREHRPTKEYLRL